MFALFTPFNFSNIFAAQSASDFPRIKYQRYASIYGELSRPTTKVINLQCDSMYCILCILDVYEIRMNGTN